MKKDDEGAIAIAPANPEVVYVPYYEPSEVVVYQPAPVFHYYPIGYPLYYYPYPVNYAFDTGFFWGVTTAFVIGWHTHHLIIEHCGFAGHPYYGRHYYEPFYVRNDIHVNVVNVHRGGEVWQPRPRDHGRPFAVSDERRVGNPYAGGRRERGTVANGGRFAGPHEDSRANGGVPGVRGGNVVPQRDTGSTGVPPKYRQRPSAPQRATNDAQRAPQTSGRDAGSAGAPPKFQQRPSTPQGSTREVQRAPQSDTRDDGRHNDFVAGAVPRTPQYRVPAPSSRRALGAPRTLGGVVGAARQAPPPPQVAARPQAAVPQQTQRSVSPPSAASSRPTYVGPPGRGGPLARPTPSERVQPQRIERAPQSRGGVRGNAASRGRDEAGRHSR